MKLQTTDGIEMQLDPAEMKMLFARRSGLDNQRDPNGAMIVTTQWRDRIVITDQASGQLSGATLWGPVEVALADVGYFVQDREMDAGHQLLLRDGTRLWLVPRRRSMALHSTRLGRLELPTVQIVHLGRLLEVNPPGDGNDGNDADSADASPALLRDEPAPPRCELVGDSRIAGMIDVDQINVRNRKEVRTIEMAKVQSIRQNRVEGLNPHFSVKLVGGEQIDGHLGRVILPVRSGDRTWQIPAAHLISYVATTDEASDGQADASDEGAVDAAVAGPLSRHGVTGSIPPGSKVKPVPIQPSAPGPPGSLNP
jgi:hypothetical protein